jgi:soluble lytic murein transglycosylase-like protein
VFGGLLLSLLIPEVVAGATFCDDLRAFYATRLFALDTRLVVLGRQHPATPAQQQERTALQAARRRLAQRLHACEAFSARFPQKGSTEPPLSRVEIDRLITDVAARYRLNPAFVQAVVRAESNYDVYAHSTAGAMGLMQLMPETARELGVHNPWDPQENLDAGVRYLAALLREFRDAQAALIAYNAGPEYIRQGWQPPAESQRYVRHVLHTFRRLVRARESGR